MSRDRLSHGEMIAGISAILLSYFMCLDWFGSTYSGESGLLSVSVGRTAWEALDYIPIVLGAAIIAALIAPMLRGVNFIYKRSVSVNAIVGLLGIVSVLLILFRILDPPNFGSFIGGIYGGFPETVTIEGTVQFPISLALAAAVGIAFGGCLAMREEGFSVSDLRPRRHRDQGLPRGRGRRSGAAS